MLKRAIMVALGAVLALAVVMPMAFGQVGQGSVASGTADELDAAWWQWAVSTPMAKSPLNGGDPSYSELGKCNGQPVTEVTGEWWFLAASGAQLSPEGGGIITGSGDVRTCTVPEETQIFFPIQNNMLTTTVDITDPALTPEQRELALMEATRNITADLWKDADYHVEIDGKAVKASQIVYAESSPYTLNFADHNYFADYGYVGQQTAASAGYYVMLPPLSKGEHTIYWKGVFEYDGGRPIYKGGPVWPAFPFGLETTYHITVE